MNQIIMWTNQNLQSLSSIVLPTDHPHRPAFDTNKLQVNENSFKNISPDNKLTSGQYHFLNQIIDLISDIVQLQIGQVMLNKPRLTDQERKMRR